MFQCQSCQKTTEAGQPVNMVVTEQRQKSYVNIIKKEFSERAINSIGWEVAKQLKVCPSCYQTMTGLQPKLILEERKNKVVPRSKPFNERPHYKKPYNKNQPDNKNNIQPPRKKPIVEVVSTFKQSRPN